MLACSGPDVIPSSLKSHVDQQIDFAALRSNISAYEGRLILVGGEVLTAKRFRDHTQIEVLHCPLAAWLDPVRNRTRSQGRFLALQKDFLDPAIFPPGTRVTLVGEVTGSKTLPLDDVEYEYPVLSIHHLTVWPSITISESWSPFGYPWRTMNSWPIPIPPLPRH